MGENYQDGDTIQDTQPTSEPTSGSAARAPTTSLAERPLHCLVFDSKLPMSQPNSHVIWVNDSQREFDLLLLSETPRPEQLTNFLLRSSNPAAPVVTLGDLLPGRADLVLPASEPSSLSQALLNLYPLIARVGQLPNLPSGLNRLALLALALAQTRESDIVPAWDPNARGLVSYPLLRGFTEPRELLEQLADSGLLRRQFFDRTYLCEHCHSARIHPREVCVSCASSNLSDHHLMHHYACGFQASVEKFTNGDGYQCPKCEKTLRHYGVDYDKPGQLVRCETCDTSMSEPNVQFACADCNHYTPGDTARQLTWFQYALSGDAVSALYSSELGNDGLGSGWSKSGSKLGAHPMFRDFMLLAQSYAQIAIRCDRPLSALLLTVDTGPGPTDQTAAFVADLIKETLRSGDLVTCVAQHIVALLPETADSAAQNSLQRIEDALAKNSAKELKMTSRVLARGEILGTLRGLS